jgi:hypothetical protein
MSSSPLSIDGSSVGLSQLLQKAQGQSGQATQTSGGVLGADAAPGITTTPPAAHARHHHHRHGGGLFARIEEAVTRALGSAGTGDSSADPNQVIQDAIASVIKDSGAAPAASPAPGAVASAAQGSTEATQQAFLTALQNHGITPEQFYQDLKAAVEGARNGPTSSGGALKSFPLGASTDVTG